MGPALREIRMVKKTTIFGSKRLQDAGEEVTMVYSSLSMYVPATEKVAATDPSAVQIRMHDYEISRIKYLVAEMRKIQKTIEKRL